MCDSTPMWLQQYSQPFTRQCNVQCHSGHVHQNNMPAAGFVLVRLNESSQLELLLDLRSNTVEHPNTWGFIGGNLRCVNENPLDAAYREAQEEYGVCPNDINILGFQYKHDHGGIKYLTYTYIFAEYNGQAPAPLTNESVQSQWFTLDALPDNLMMYIREDLQVLQHTLYTEIYPMLEAQGINSPNPCAPKPCTPNPRVQTPCVPKPCTPKPCTPNPRVQTPCVPKPCTPKPCTPKPCTPKPCTPKPCTPKPCTPKPCTPNPRVQTPCVPKPCTPKPCTPNPRVQTPCVPKPCTPKPCTPKPCTPNPRVQTPCVPKPCTPKPCTPNLHSEALHSKSSCSDSLCSEALHSEALHSKSLCSDSFSTSTS
ncbi:NUDIX hydrolase domain-like protein [Xylaria longipes]|nr:NUDIX hydrolase domain-like protein [Xylaria longipes]